MNREAGLPFRARPLTLLLSAAALRVPPGPAAAVLPGLAGHYVVVPIPVGGVQGVRPPSAQERVRTGAAHKGVGTPAATQHVVAHSGFSKPVFLDRFRKATGTSPMKWLSERKIAEAKRLLLEKDTRDKTILGVCSFRFATAFRETFRHHTGLCPKQWQQRQRQGRSAK